MGYSDNARTDDPTDLYKIASLRYKEFKEQEMPRSVLSKVSKIPNVRLPNHHPHDREWVLRNLTTHEFVRSEIIAGNSEQNGPFFEDIGFEQIKSFSQRFSGLRRHGARILLTGAWIGEHGQGIVSR